MSGEDKEKKLDELISRAIDSGKPEFDAEKWKQKFPREFEMLVTRTSVPAQTKHRWRRVAGITILAACVVLAAIVFTIEISTRDLRGSQDTCADYILTNIGDKADKINTSPIHILEEIKKHNLKEMRPCDILPPSR